MHSERTERIRKRFKRALRVRKTLKGTSEKPRLSVFKSNRNISVQVIDDESGKTLCYAGTLSKDTPGKKGKESARVIGSAIAEKAKQAKISEVVFDRGRYKYHGVIAELADAAREAGLRF